MELHVFPMFRSKMESKSIGGNNSMIITLGMSKGAYDIARKVYAGTLTRREGKSKIAETTGMNEGSAQAFITIFLAMLNGEEYKRSFNNETNRFLFESIKIDYGKDFLKNALKAAQQHIDYYSTLNRGNLTGLQDIVNEMTGQLNE